MNIFLVSKTSISQFTPHFSPQIFISQFPSLFRKNQTFPNLPFTKCSSYTPKIQTFCINSLSFGGWDYPQLGCDDSALSCESTQLQKILNSLGINDKKYIFVYLLGFICALAVFRIRVSSIIAIPACFIVFGVGFSIGYVNGGQLSFNGIKKRPRDEIFNDFIEKLSNLVDMINGVDVNIVNLKDCVKKSIESNRITSSDLEGVVEIAEAIDLSVLDGKRIIEGLMESIVIENKDPEKNRGRKPSRRKEVGENLFDFPRFISRLFRENSFISNANKMKNLGKSELWGVEVNDGKGMNILAPGVEEQIPSTSLNRGGDNRNGNLLRRNVNRYSIPRAGVNGNGVSENENMSLKEMDNFSEESFEHKEEYHYRDKRLRYFNSRQVSSNRTETWDSDDGSLDSMDFSVRLKHTKTDALFREEQNVRDWRGNNMEFDRVEESETESTRNNGYGSSPSLIFREDTEFNKYLTEADILLKEAKQVLWQQAKDGNAENALYQSAKLLSKAVDIRPMSLLAVGQLGNTYLLHGELKLRISRELRAMIGGSDHISIDKWGINGLDDHLSRKDKLISILVNVCEECEELLIKSGRNYRLALSIDGNDMRALYNWGLALSFRAQLIADIGPGAAHDADKVFLAAIDKFDAMLSISSSYAPDALFRWGAALQ